MQLFAARPWITFIKSRYFAVYDVDNEILRFVEKSIWLLPDWVTPTLGFCEQLLLHEP